MNGYAHLYGGAQRLEASNFCGAELTGDFEPLNVYSENKTRILCMSTMDSYTLGNLSCQYPLSVLLWQKLRNFSNKHILILKCVS